MLISHLLPLLSLAGIGSAADSVYFNLDAAFNTDFIRGFLDTNIRTISNENM